MAANLALSFVQGGKRVLYIDADLRRPRAHSIFGVPREPGLVELLFSVDEQAVLSAHSPVDGLQVVPAGRSSSVPGELLASNRMREFITRMRDRYDYIVLDSPPLMAVNDPVLIASYSDYRVVVVSTGETSLSDIDRAQEALQSVSRQIDGIVLNRFDAQRAYGYSYGSKGYGYGTYQYGTTV